jgi:hypothetical protein
MVDHGAAVLGEQDTLHAVAHGSVLLPGGDRVVVATFVERSRGTLVFHGDQGIEILASMVFLVLSEIVTVLQPRVSGRLIWQLDVTDANKRRVIAALFGCLGRHPLIVR